MREQNLDDQLRLHCVECGHRFGDHVDRKCLFGPKQFRALTTKEMFDWLVRFHALPQVEGCLKREITNIEFLPANDKRRVPALRIMSLSGANSPVYLSKPWKNKFGLWAYITFPEYADAVLGKTEIWKRWEWH